MYQEERLRRLAELLLEKQTLSCREIMELFQISRDTARRDILRLVAGGGAARTHGGVTLLPERAPFPDYPRRAQIAKPAKQALARRAARRLAGARTCFLDVSSTVEELCDLLPEGLEVYTHSLRNALRLAGGPCGVHLLGGGLNHVNLFFSGVETAAQLEDHRYDIAVLGAGAVCGQGFFYQDEEDAALKRRVVERSRFVCVLADCKAFRRERPHRGARLDQIHLLITNGQPPRELAERLALLEVEVETEGGSP